MIKHGYSRSKYDSCVYHRKLHDGSFVYLLLYIDDMLIAVKNISEVVSWKLNSNKSLRWKIWEQQRRSWEWKFTGIGKKENYSYLRWNTSRGVGEIRHAWCQTCENSTCCSFLTFSRFISSNWWRGEVYVSCSLCQCSWKHYVCCSVFSTRHLTCSQCRESIYG